MHSVHRFSHFSFVQIEITLFLLFTREKMPYLSTRLTFSAPSLSPFDLSLWFPWFVCLRHSIQILLNVHSDLLIQSPYMGKKNKYTHPSALATGTCCVLTYSICPIFVRPRDLQCFNSCVLPALRGLWLTFIMKQSGSLGLQLSGPCANGLARWVTGYCWAMALTLSSARGMCARQVVIFLLRVMTGRDPTIRLK